MFSGERVITPPVLVKGEERERRWKRGDWMLPGKSQAGGPVGRSGRQTLQAPPEGAGGGKGVKKGRKGDMKKKIMTFDFSSDGGPKDRKSVV